MIIAIKWLWCRLLLPLQSYSWQRHTPRPWMSLALQENLRENNEPNRSRIVKTCQNSKHQTSLSNASRIVPGPSLYFMLNTKRRKITNCKAAHRFAADTAFTSPPHKCIKVCDKLHDLHANRATAFSQLGPSPQAEESKHASPWTPRLNYTTEELPAIAPTQILHLLEKYSMPAPEVAELPWFDLAMESSYSIQDVATSNWMH